MNSNKRWYCNKLSDTPIKDTTDYDDVITKASGVSVEAKHMRNSVMKRLLDKTISPTLEMKRKCFRKMVENDEHAKTIINLSIEMGSSMEETKHTLLNNITDQACAIYLLET